MPTAITPIRVAGSYEDRYRERFKGKATGAAAIDHTVTPRLPFKVIGAELHLGGNPTTSENFQVSIDAGDGTAYDIVLLKRDLSVKPVVDLAWDNPNKDKTYDADDVIAITFPNTETNTYGLEVVYELA